MVILGPSDVIMEILPIKYCYFLNIHFTLKMLAMKWQIFLTIFLQYWQNVNILLLKQYFMQTLSMLMQGMESKKSARTICFSITAVCKILSLIMYIYFIMQLTNLYKPYKCRNQQHILKNNHSSSDRCTCFCYDISIKIIFFLLSQQ